MFAARQRIDLRRVEECVERVLGRDERILLAVVFGSAARGEPARDVDIGVYTAGELGIMELALYEAELVECIGYEVDLVPLAEAPPLLRVEALRGGRVVFSRGELLPLDLLLASEGELWDTRLKRRLVARQAGSED